MLHTHGMNIYFLNFYDLIWLSVLLHRKEICFLTVATTVFLLFHFPCFLLCSCFVFVATGELIGVKYLYAQTGQVLQNVSFE